MKKLLIAMVALMLTGAVTAQHIGHGFGGYRAPRVVVTGGFYPYLGLGLGSIYPYAYYPYANPYGYSRPSKMTLQVQDIKNDYADKIWSAKHDKSLPKKERKQQVHDLKVERDNAINDLKHNYYKH